MCIASGVHVFYTAAPKYSLHRIKFAALAHSVLSYIVSSETLQLETQAHRDRQQLAGRHQPTKTNKHFYVLVFVLAPGVVVVTSVTLRLHWPLLL